MFDKLWDFLQGKKMYMGGIALILTGLGEIVLGYTNSQGFSKDGWEKIIAGWLAISAKSALTKKNPEPLQVAQK